MFIINIDDMNKSNLYECDIHTSYRLQKNGFSLLSKNGDKYYFYKTEKLIKFLSLLGKEVNEN